MRHRIIELALYIFKSPGFRVIGKIATPMVRYYSLLEVISGQTKLGALTSILVIVVCLDTTFLFSIYLLDIIKT
jgi:hypothetical protein